MSSCFRSHARWWPWAFGLLLVVDAMPVMAQSRTVDQSVDLIVEGRVERLFRDGSRFLVQILVRGAEAPLLNPAGGIRYPAPGHYVYVHVDADESESRRVSPGSLGPQLPNPNSLIRAKLSAGDAGRWVASGQDWFEDSTGRSRHAPLDGNSAQAALGIQAERAFVRGQSALKVTRVTPQSPAGNAGIEVGDLIVKAAGKSLESQAQLEEVYRNSRNGLQVIVRDVRSEREVSVEIKSSGASGEVGKQTARSLGVATETAFYRGEAALKVTQVDARGPARGALRPGLLILKVDGRAVAKPEELKAAVQRSRGQVEIEVVDPSDRKVRTIRVRL